MADGQWPIKVNLIVKADTEAEAVLEVVMRMNTWFMETTQFPPPFPPGTLLHFAVKGSVSGGEGGDVALATGPVVQQEPVETQEAWLGKEKNRG